MEIQYQIIRERKILFQKFIGTFSIEVFASYVEKISENQEWKYIAKVLTDCRETNLEFALENLDKISKNRTEVGGKEILNILLVDKPSTTVVAQLYINKLKKIQLQTLFNIRLCNSFIRIK